MRGALHWVARPRPGFRVVAPRSARWLWERLKEAFPSALACCLMPDHVHLLVPGHASEETWRRILGQHGRHFGTQWTTHSQPATTAKVVWRVIRYVVNNPVRAGLVDDPWCWPWSTLRDLGGVIARPWTVASVREAARSVGVSRARVLPELSSLNGAPVPVPKREDPETAPVVSLSAIAAAVASTLRCEPSDIRRRGPARTLFLHMAARYGAVPKQQLADACGLRIRAIRKTLQHPPPPSLRPALRCLQDPRLRIHDVHEDVPASPVRKHLAPVRL